jgi:predicted extracellular nuclease/phosphatidylserine/phosphatidylglycerophosphate/cardiolipin synthase-like enzyme
MLSITKSAPSRLIATVGIILAILLGSLGVGLGLSPALGAVPPSKVLKASTEAPTSLVISQIYGGGGNAGSLYTHDFIELFNPTSAPISVTNWSVQYNSAASATGNPWQVSVLTGTVTLQPGQYYLIREANGTGGTQPLPTPDSLGSIPMSATAGKVALVNNTTPLTCGTGCLPNANIIDFVGYGPTANSFEGSGPAPILNNTSSDIRAAGGCTDNDNNATDFTVISPPTPRNSASTFNPCATGGTPTDTSTPGGPTNTSVATSTVGATSTSTTTPITATTNVLLYMLYYTTYAGGQSDEAVRLINTSSSVAMVGNWSITDSTGAVTLPLTATIAPNGKIWVANSAASFRSLFGFSPDYEYATDSDPTVPQAAASAGFNFPDAGDAVQLRDMLSANLDTLVYKNGSTATIGWSGTAVRPYLPSGQPTFTEDGQILYRKLDQLTGRPYADTNTDNDWAEDNDPSGAITPVPNDREFDDVSGKKFVRPAWALTDPAFEDMFFTKKYTETNVTTKFLVNPDNGYEPIHQMIVSATTSITIETYEFKHLGLAQDIIDAKNRGVAVTALFDGNPCCTNRPGDETLWVAQQWDAAGIPVYFMSGAPNLSSDKYRYNNLHAKIMIVDDQWVLTGSDNFAYSGLADDPRGNGTAGARGAMIITNAPNVVAHTRRMVNFDFQPGKYPDIVRWNTAPGFGTPAPGFTPTVLPDMTGYNPVKPTALVVTETQSIEIVQAPDNALRDVDSLIGMVNRAGAGDEVMVQQQYERKYWETGTTTHPNPRLEAYIQAARRGANVRIILDGFFEGGDCTSLTHNPATVAYVNGMGLPNLQARLSEATEGQPVGQTVPTTGNVHNKMVLVRDGTDGYIHVTSINGSLNSSKNNREYGFQVQSNAGYQYYKDVFDYDWSVAFLPCGQGPTATPGSATPTSTPICNALINPGFETGDIAPWVTTNAAVTAVADNELAHTGDYSIAISHNLVNNSQGVQQNISTTITAGQVYRVEGYVYRPDSNIVSARVRVAWYNCVDFSCSQASTSDVFAGNTGLPDWQFFSGTVTAPAGALAARYRLIFTNGSAVTSTIHYDDVVFECASTGTATPVATTAFTATPTATVVVMPIGSVQGSGLTSPVLSQTVTIAGVVTLVKGNGYFVQDAGDGDPATSDGIFIFTSSFPSTVAVGNSVTVTGTVAEFRAATRPCDLTLTQLTNTTLTNNGAGVVPTPVVISDVPENTVIYPNAINFYEKYENMLLQVTNAVVVGPTNPAFGEFWVVAGGDAVPGSGYMGDGHILVHPTATADVDYNPERILIDDESRVGGGNNTRIVGADGQSLVNTGDRASSLTGVLEYGFSNYRVQPSVDPEAAITRDPVPTPPASQLRPPAPDEFRVVSFNMENYFDGLPNPNQTQTAVPTAEIMTKTLKVMQAISVELRLPDIIVLQEIEDAAVLNGDSNGNVPGSNVRAVVPRLNDAGYPYVAVSAGSSDVRGIENGFMYRTDRATLQSYYLATDITPDPGVVWVEGREPLVGNFTIGGHSITIIGNHWKSKSGDQPLYGDPMCQPPNRTTEPLRKSQAQYVRDFVNSLETMTPTIKLMVAGDLNDFYFPEPGEGRDPVTIVKGGTISDTSTMTNLTELVPEVSRFSYNFEGNSQVLDHILVNPNLDAFRRDQAFAHFDSEFHQGYATDPSVPYSVSDHDPPVGYFANAGGGTSTPTVAATGTSTVQSTSTVAPSSTRTATITVTTTWTPTTTKTPTPTNTITNTQTVPPTSTTTATASPTCAVASTWVVVPSQNVGTEENRLQGVAAVSSNYVWAVGYYKDGGVAKPLIQRWDGSSWSIVPSPAFGLSNNYLLSVTAISANDAWAVGYYRNLGSNLDETLTMHWNGTAWSVVSSPNHQFSGGTYLYGVSGSAANDVWAVGWWDDGDTNQLYAIRWNGTSWSEAALPNVGPAFNVLSGVTAISANDVWAVGLHASGNGSSPFDTLTLHWNGTSWTMVEDATPANFNSRFEAVDATSPNDVWAVGWGSMNDQPASLIQHWNGTAWSIVNSPSPGTMANYLIGVSATAPNDAWAVGAFDNGSGRQTLTMHWDGTQWLQVASPHPTGPNAQGGAPADTQQGTTKLAPMLNTGPGFAGVAAVSDRDIWAVGGYGPAATSRTLIERYYNPNPCAVTPTATSVASNTPTRTVTAIPSGTTTRTATAVSTGTPTLTVMPSTTRTSTVTVTTAPTNTSTSVVPTSTGVAATPTSCSLTFSDVPSSNTFYTYIRCLVCRGIISGYSDGTFRPNNDITRGQISKIVSQSAGFSEPAGSQIYEDVPPASPFFTWIQRLSNRGLVGGYRCGMVPDEPCVMPGNRPYFRPNASATRGQLSKIVASARGITTNPTGETYQDVGTTHPFYVWIEQLSNLGVMGGYPCGTVPGEPCGTSNKPYFRPDANVTRGQASKIVANTFFPNCVTP